MKNSRNPFRYYLAGKRQKEHDAFLLEFVDQPQAVSLLFRFQCGALVFCFGPLLAALIGIYFPWSIRFVSSEGFQNWISFVCMPCTFFVSNYDHAFVRAVLKRRARLAAVGYPRFAEKLFLFFMPHETADEAIEHLNAKFEVRKTRYGTRYARRWYWYQVMLSAFPAIERLINLAIKWGIVAWIRRHWS